MKTMSLRQISVLLTALYDASDSDFDTDVYIDYEEGVVPIEEIRIEEVNDKLAVIIK